MDEKKRLEDGSRKLGGKFKKKALKIFVGKNGLGYRKCNVACMLATLGHNCNLFVILNKIA